MMTHLELACSLSRGERHGEVLAARTGRVTVRTSDNAGSVIVKLWSLRDAKSIVRRITGRTKGHCEWTALSRLHALGIEVPQPRAFLSLGSGHARHHEALIAEDLAPCISAGKHLHRMVRSGDNAGADTLSDRILDLTRRIIEAGILDTDHRLANFVIREDGMLYRVDFENAKICTAGRRHDKMLGAMLGGLTSSYAWAVRHEPSLALRFMERTLEVLRPNVYARRRARLVAAKDFQSMPKGKDFTLPEDLGW